MKILYLSSETAPYSKTGGLADVAASLPKALVKAGAEVLVVTPRYSTIKQSLNDTGVEVNVPFGTPTTKAHIFNDGESLIFIDCPDYYGREFIYSTPDGDYPDNDIRFAFFSYAALEAARAKKFKPDIVHLHDWQTAPAAIYLKHQFNDDSFFSKCRIVLTIHNLGYQGLFDWETLKRIAFPESYFTPDVLEFWGRVNLLKGAIALADRITTVSEGYAREIMSQEHGVGLDGLLRSRANVVKGILNGVDYGEWNPATDKFIARNYSPADMTGKKECRRDLIRTFGFKLAAKTPLIGMVSRLAEQKGFDLIEKILPELMKRNVGLVLLGAGEKRYQTPLEEFASKHAGRFGLRIGYDNALAHKIEAGADMFLMPSRYEPCGLNQMYSLKYGCVPIVRATGGLDDTVHEYPDGGTGFKFNGYNTEELLACIDRALTAFANKPLWTKIVANGMEKDHSWDESAKKYMELFSELINLK